MRSALRSKSLLSAALACAIAVAACDDPSEDTPDGGDASDAGPAAGSDAGAPNDAGTTDAGTADGGTPDAGTPDAGTTDGGMALPTDREKLDALMAALPGAANDGARASLVEAFGREVELGGGGFPIHEPGTLTFVFWDPSKIPGVMSVAGDMNGWSTTADVMTQPQAGFPLYVATVPVTEALGRTGYKFVREGVNYFADPAARRFIHDQNGELSLAVAGGGAGHLERWRGFEGGALADRTLYVYVPAAAGPYPTLYLQDGQNVFHPDVTFGGWKADDSAEALLGSSSIRPVLMVGIPNSPSRFEEYTFVTDRIGGNVVGGEGAAYETLVMNVKAFIDTKYATLPGPANTAIAGSSLGGLASLWIAQRNPSVFGYAASMSGTIGWGSISQTNPTVIASYKMTPPTGLHLYVDSGGGPGSGCVDTDADGLRDDGDGSDNYCENLDLRDALLSLGWQQNVDLTYVHDPNAGHNEAAWAARFPALLMGFFPRK